MLGVATPSIRDRFDLTLECIRRHYFSERSPLSDVLARYEDFLCLFGSFKGYVEFFLLQDLVSPDYSAVRFSAAVHRLHWVAGAIDFGGMAQVP